MVWYVNVIKHEQPEEGIEMYKNKLRGYGCELHSEDIHRVRTVSSRVTPFLAIFAK